MEDGAKGPAVPLTPREEEVGQADRRAHTNAQIAQILHLARRPSSRTAPTCSQLGMRDRVELVRYAIRRGLVEP